jgi:hypothetical protein
MNLWPLSFFLVFFVCLFAVLGFELRAFTLTHFIKRFCDGFFEMGSHELFAPAGFEPQSS